MQRALILQFYYDICTGYKLADHVPQCAITIWDGIQHYKRPLSHAAAALLIAQKWSDIKVFPIGEVSKLFGVSAEAISAAEVGLFKVFLNVKTLRPDRLLSDRLICFDATTQRCIRQFFHMSTLGTRIFITYINYSWRVSRVTEPTKLSVNAQVEASVIAAGEHTSCYDPDILAYAQRLRSRTSTDFSVRVAVLAATTQTASSLHQYADQSRYSAAREKDTTIDHVPVVDSNGHSVQRV